jgi:methylmalonyl-CoA mutase cobalamin-binding subunit
MMKTVVAGALGECVHVAGVVNFLRLAEQVGWRTVFLGPAVAVKDVLEAARREKADLVGISYRLTPENGERLLAEFAEAADDLRADGVRFAFGGTPPVARKAKSLGFFESVFDGSESTQQVVSYLKGLPVEDLQPEDFPQTTIERIRWKSPLPLLRHHFGLPDFERTVAEIEEIAEAGVLDVVSLGIDQDAQENFFHPERQDKRRKGAGGVPVRSAGDYRRLYQATRRGNFPLMRTYSGTDDFIRLAEMYHETINIAWAAVPLFWFNQMDGRGPFNLEESIREHQQLMTWYGQHNIPVEANEAHHWGMRDSSDVIFVVSAYLAAYNAQECGVKDHIVQMMFNSPPGTSAAMDLAKMMAVKRLVSTLESSEFRLWWQTRTGLLSYPLNPEAARAHLSTSIFLQMMVAPDIVHVVGYPEADHAVTGAEVIESCKMAQRSIEQALGSGLAITELSNVQQRTAELMEEAEILVEAIRAIDQSVKDPLVDAEVLSQAVRLGLMDAPQLINNPYGKGIDVTRVDPRGACVSLDPRSGETIPESERIEQLMMRRSNEDS